MTTQEKGKDLGNEFISGAFDGKDVCFLGLTKREYFAGLAMNGLLSSGKLITSDAALLAVNAADYILIELSKTDVP